MRALRRRGVRILPGGDYGFAWTPHGTNAKDLEYFVKYVGMSPMEALLSATAWGGPMMRMGKVLGYIREGCLADILLIDGDPLADITVLQDKARIMAVMKDGEFHRAPPLRSARTTRWATA
jgi:imidazolonepropionase-like amidohydrolase